MTQNIELKQNMRAFFNFTSIDFCYSHFYLFDHLQIVNRQSMSIHTQPRNRYLTCHPHKRSYHFVRSLAESMWRRIYIREMFISYKIASIAAPTKIRKTV